MNHHTSVRDRFMLPAFVLVFLTLLAQLSSAQTPAQTSAPASGATFWAGNRLNALKERKWEAWYRLSQGGGLAVRYRPMPAYAVLLRGGRCYVLDTGKYRGVVEQLPILPGDKFFDYEDLPAAVELKLPILKGEEAAEALLNLEEARTGKRPVYVPEKQE